MGGDGVSSVCAYHCNGFTPTPPGELGPARSISSSVRVPLLSVRSITSALHGVAAFDNPRGALEDVLRLDSDNSVPRMLSRLGRTTPCTADFWNVRHIRTTADSSDRVSVVARVAPPSSALFPPVSLRWSRKIGQFAKCIPTDRGRGTR